MQNSSNQGGHSANLPQPSNSKVKGNSKGKGKRSKGKGRRSKGKGNSSNSTKGNSKGKGGAQRTRRGPPMWQREWNHLTSSSTRSFTIVSYNVLAQSNLSAHGHMYGRALRMGYAGWEWRFGNLVEELKHHRPSIACLQEVDRTAVDQFESQLSLRSAGWCARSNDKSKTDGCCLLFDPTIWKLRESVLLPLNVQDRSGCAVVVALQREDGLVVVAGSTHLLFNPKRGEVRLRQAGMVLAAARTIQQQLAADGHQVAALVLCGDMNSSPSSAVYDLFRGAENPICGIVRQEDSQQEAPFEASGHLSAGSNQLKHPGSGIQVGSRDNLEQEMGQLLAASALPSRGIAADQEPSDTRTESNQSGLSLEGGLHSAYSEPSALLPTGCPGEPAFTTFLEHGTKGCVDYILFSSQLKLVARLELLHPEVLRKHGGLPTMGWSSDHMALVAKLAPMAPLTAAPMAPLTAAPMAPLAASRRQEQQCAVVAAPAEVRDLTCGLEQATRKPDGRLSQHNIATTSWERPVHVERYHNNQHQLEDEKERLEVELQQQIEQLIKQQATSN